MLIGEHRCSCGKPLAYNRTHIWDGDEVCEDCFEFERSWFEQSRVDELSDWDTREARRGLLVLMVYSVAIALVFWFASRG